MTKANWWQHGVGYQIYPKSFFDANGDGIGDLAGIKEKIDYLDSLNIDFVWLCPIYKSPGIDNGYDIADYRDVDPQYGSMADLDILIQELHNHNIKIVMDMVLNHSSDQNQWFLDAKRDINSKYHDYYIWKKGKDGGTPNNWTSLFGGSAWQYNKATDEYYYHLYAKQQPDLNWENPQLRHEMHDIIKFWIKRGIDGFRLDAITHLKKLQTFEDVDNPDQASRNIPGIEVFLRELKNIYDDYGVMTVGEVGAVPPESAIKWVNPDTGYMDLLFQFDHVNFGDSHKFDFATKSIPTVKEKLTAWQSAAADQGNLGLFIENHDLPRAVSYFGSEEKAYRNRSAKAVGLMYFMMKGTPFIYQGQELGMINDHIETINDVTDIDSLRHYRERIQAGYNTQMALHEVAFKGRDNARTPMQWSAKPLAGFSQNTSWIKVADSFKTINVAEEESDSQSVLNFYRKLINLKKTDETLQDGQYALDSTTAKNVIAYQRFDAHATWLVVANLSNKVETYQLPQDLANHTYQTVLGNNGCNIQQQDHLKLAAWGAILLKFEK